jgi:dolichyl-phosphate beta-glucosyltransferase
MILPQLSLKDFVVQRRFMFHKFTLQNWIFLTVAFASTTTFALDETTQTPCQQIWAAPANGSSKSTEMDAASRIALSELAHATGIDPGLRALTETVIRDPELQAARAEFEKGAHEELARQSFDPKELRQDFEEILSLSKSQLANSTRPLLSIVIPAYKEALRLPKSLVTIQDFLKLFPLNVEVLVMVEKSPDDTLGASRAVIRDGENRIQIVDNIVQRGKGYAVHTGMLRAQGTYTLFMDADLSTPLPEILKFLKTMMKDPEIDVLVGNRNNPDSEYFRNRGLARRIMSEVFAQVVQRKLGMPGITDTQAGFKMFKTTASHDIFSRQKLEGFSFDVEALVLAQRLHHPVAEQSIHWADAKGSTVNPIVDSWKMLKDIFKVQSFVDQNLRATP